MYDRKKTKLVKGIGINDADYPVNWVDEAGNKCVCPLYKRWVSMLDRATNPKFIIKRPSYAGTTVHPQWLSFMNFRKWMLKRNWEGKHLDKDIKVAGNKEYGPDTCLLVSPAVNNVLVLREAGRGAHPLGVTTMTVKGILYYVAACSFYGKQKRLGYFKTAQEASDAYQAAKSAYIKELAAAETDLDVKAALLSVVLPK